MEDPSTNPPAASEPAIHVAHLANPTPSHAPVHNHPPYAEMITAAIAALKERNGSSRRAIAKYIEKEYSNLPPTHSALLTHHIKRLKNNGQLVMVKRSYTLPGSTAVTAPTFPFNTDTAAAASSNGPKRGRGRPPKPKANAVVQPTGENGSEAMLVSLGLVDGPGNVAKRTPRRPKRPKVKAGLVGQTMTARGRGRPAKPKPLFDATGQVEPKRQPGRPRSTGSGGVSGAGNIGRPRGRPKKGDSAQVKPRGRPRKKIQSVGVICGGVLPAKRPDQPLVVAAPKKPRKLTGKPLGRPRKNAPRAIAESSDSQYLVAYQDLKTKYDYVQSKVQLSISLIKPHLNNETPVSIVRAVEEMEGLAKMDTTTAPINVQVQVQQPLI